MPWLDEYDGLDPSFAAACRKADDKPGRSNEPPPVNGPEDYGTVIGDEPPTGYDEPSQVAPAALITPAHWPEEAPLPVDWLAEERIPRGDVTTLHGDGGAGKTDIALQLSANSARRSGYWLGHAIAGGPVVVISAEEPEREVRRRIWLHGQRDEYSPAELSDLYFWFPDDGSGAVLAVPNRASIMQPTPLFISIKAAIADVGPVLVVVDNVASTFAGNQNDRVMVGVT
jgi:RecA-family ATPase